MCCDSYIGIFNRLRHCNIVFVYIVQVINFVYNKEFRVGQQYEIFYNLYVPLGNQQKLIMCHISVESASNIAITTEKRMQILLYVPQQ